MKIAGIVAEYNPFHNGHAFQIAKTRQNGATHIVAVMGGNFLQRGAPAQFEKHLRAEAALCCGVDLVLELPLPCAMATAEHFAQGAISLLQALGCVNLLSFGAESPLQELSALADALAATELSAAVKAQLSLGHTFAKARQLALAELLGEERAALIASPNNILGVEYLKAARRLGFTPELCVIPRKGVAHDSAFADGAFASASLLRTAFAEHGLHGIQNFVPAAALEVYRVAQQAQLLPADYRTVESGVLSVLRRMPQEAFAALPDLSEGLENRLFGAVRRSATLEELLLRVKSKRYPLARIRRLVLSAYLGMTAADAQPLPPYLRVLGFNRQGLEILNLAKQQATLPLSSSLAQLEQESPLCAQFAQLEARSTDLFALMLPKPLPCGYDYTCKPVMLKKL